MLQLLGWPRIPLPKELLFTRGSLSKPAMGCIELILLTARGIPRCRIIFPVSVNHFTAAFPDSYASDLLISPLVIHLFIYFLVMTSLTTLWLSIAVRLGSHMGRLRTENIL